MGFNDYLQKHLPEKTAYRIHKDTGLNKESIRRWVNDERYPDELSQRKLCEIYGLDAYDMAIFIMAMKQTGALRDKILASLVKP